MEELRFEAESNAELAATRLTEISELNATIRRQAEELQRAKLVVLYLSLRASFTSV